MKHSCCELCGRTVPRLTVHHLVPRQFLSRKRRRRAKHISQQSQVVHLCPACHRQIHRLFSNKTLANQLHSLSRLRNHPEVRKFLRWVQKQDPEKRIRVHRAKNRP